MKLVRNFTKKRSVEDFFSLVVLVLFSTLGVESQAYSPFNRLEPESSSLLSRVRRGANDFSGLMPSNYSVHVLPPTQNGGPTQANVSVIIMNVRDIRELGEEVSLEMNLRVLWRDSRLAEAAKSINSESGSEPSFTVLQPNLIHSLWHPDIFIDHLKSVSQPILISPPASLRLYPDTTLRFSTRITVTLACKMDFIYYPADTQRCHVEIKSYAYSDKKMSLSWTESHGASFANQLDLPNYFVGMENPDTFSITTTSGSYSGLRFTILLTRKLSYHLFQTYLPSSLLVLISWLSFLLSPESIPGRMTLCMTCLLSLISMFVVIRQSTPNVSYVKAIDAWMVVCVGFVFLALVEFTIVIKIRSPKPKKKQESSVLGSKNSDSVTDQTIGLNHFNLMRGARGSVATVYYPNSNQPQMPTRRLSQPRLSLSLPINEENEMDEYSRPGNESSAIYGSRPFPPRTGASQAPPPLSLIPVPETLKVPTAEEIRAGRIELMASLLLPTLFLLWNCLYWPWLIAFSEYFNY